MIKAQLITIGTEITSGEVLNSNAAWVSRQLEELGVRVFSHLSVRDQREEIAKALATAKDCFVVVVTGGLGPTSDDITRECLAEFTAQPLQFDQEIWRDLEQLYQQRGLPLREAHKQQCYFPAASQRLKNPVGTALGFAQFYEGRHYFILPGPPRELEGIWSQEVHPRLKLILPPNPFHWLRWTCLGAPESEIAELVEKAVAGHGLEVGYRAAIPYVKVKLYVDSTNARHQLCVREVEAALAPFAVINGEGDLAQELLQLWPEDELKLLDSVTEGRLSERLFRARDSLSHQGPKLNLHAGEALYPELYNLQVSARGDEFYTEMKTARGSFTEARTLPYKVSVASERGKRSAVEWVLWNCVRTLRASSRQA